MGSVVTKNVGPHSWTGVPARKIKARFDEETIRQLQELGWWEWPVEQVAKYAKYFDDPKSLISNVKESKPE